MIWINNTKLPDPKKYDVDEMDLMNAERTQTGAMVTDYIATKVKISLEWTVLSKEDHGLILSLVGNKDGALSVRYIHPQTGEEKTGSFYSGDRSASCLFFWNGVPTWQGLKFNLIER